VAAAITIRDLDPQRDWAEFVALNYRTFRDSVPGDEPIDEAEFKQHHQWLIAHFAPNDPRKAKVFVAEVNGAYAGHVWVGNQTDFFTKRQDPWIFDLSVKPACRRQGVASALHARAEQWVRARGGPFIGLQVMAHNEAATKLYARLGYKPRAISMMKKT
jgi:ribosomal protein S18 acetylase RimI-like enzyme